MQEFHIQSSLAPAEFPQAGGGSIDVVTKSGTKAFHGSAFEYFRNEFSDARNFFDDPTLPRPIFRQNQFGVSLGGHTERTWGHLVTPSYFSTLGVHPAMGRGFEGQPETAGQAPAEEYTPVGVRHELESQVDAHCCEAAPFLIFNEMRFREPDPRQAGHRRRVGHDGAGRFTFAGAEEPEHRQ